MADFDRIKLGMVGGGQGAFIGAVHRIAARIDDQYELVAGALSSKPDVAAASAAEIGIAADRSYGSYEEMAKAEAARDDGIEAVAIVTPNHMHYPISKAFLDVGIHVICDKPLTATMEDADAMLAACETSDALFVLTHNYTGYPMIRQARDMIASGELGDIRMVQQEYVQDWLTEAVDNKQAEWRTDPKRAGAGSLGDIGTHAFNLGCTVSGLRPSEISADVMTFVDGRPIDDNAHVMLRYENGARGMLWCSQVAVGSENGLRLRVYGSKGGLEWAQENPNKLWYTPFGETKRLLTRGGAGATEAANRVTRIPGGHPEGYLEGFATIYSEAALAIRAHRDGYDVPAELHYPDVHDGMDGMRFISACLKSSAENGKWTKF